MSAVPVVTRFAPSPTGELHLGNARTALFNALLARRARGRFLLRIEDTDAARSRPEHVAQLQADLLWLGLAWDGEPLHQSQRSEVYAGLLAQLESRGHAYPCFCGARELELARAARLAAGQPPRYSALPRAHGSTAAAATGRGRGRVAALRGAAERCSGVHGPGARGAAFQLCGHR
jgi:glutamyl-tRNA synthetase